MIELLAPAKDKRCAFAAIDFGADALYMGADEFGARKKASNSIADIKEVVDYAHLFGVKVYVTLNTILTNDELKSAKKLVKELEKINVDALIIQDLGLLDMECSIPFHASTQCDNRSVEKVKMLQDIGFTRVVLARELSLAQIKQIKEQTNIELETFIHGALCVSYSGQCYLSHAIGGRSANKGECAQPCRKKYSLVDEKNNFIAKNKYLLSLKDFNASEHLSELDKIGVGSFKIEGRLKDINYIKNVVGYYRKKIDNLAIKKTSFGIINFDFDPSLEKSFNRGFTDYFLEKRHECFSFDTPKSRGEYIGKVKEVAKEYFVLNSTLLKPQDGLNFIIEDELQGCLVNKVHGNKIYPNKMPKIQEGTEIYRNSDAEFEKILQNSKTNRKIQANIEISENIITIIDESKNTAQINYIAQEKAQNPEKMTLTIQNQFKKTGDTIFCVNEIKFACEIPFLPMSKLNELRRELLEKLKQERLNNYKVERKPFVAKPTPLNKKLDYKANILNDSAQNFYEKCGCEVVEKALESGVSSKEKTVMTTKHCLKYAFDMCKSDKKLFLIDEKGKRYNLNFDCKNCEMEVIF